MKDPVTVPHYVILNAVKDPVTVPSRVDWIPLGYAHRNDGGRQEFTGFFRLRRQNDVFLQRHNDEKRITIPLDGSFCDVRG